MPCHKRQGCLAQSEDHRKLKERYRKKMYKGPVGWEGIPTGRAKAYIVLGLLNTVLCRVRSDSRAACGSVAARALAARIHVAKCRGFTLGNVIKQQFDEVLQWKLFMRCVFARRARTGAKAVQLQVPTVRHTAAAWLKLYKNAAEYRSGGKGSASHRGFRPAKRTQFSPS